MTRRLQACVRRVVFATALALPATLPAVAEAQPRSSKAAAEADVHFRRGIELYGEADFRSALVEFKRAHEIAPNFRVLFNVAQAYYQLNDYVHALQTFEKYLAEGKDDIPIARRAEVDREVNRLRGRVATLTVTTNEKDADILVDDVRVGSSPLAPFPVNSGAHVVKVVKGSAPPVTRIVEVSGGDSTSLDLPFNAPSEAVASLKTTPLDAKPASSGTKAPVIAGWVGTGALAAGAIVTGIIAFNASTRLSAAKEDYGVSASELDTLDGRVRTFSLTADILGAAAIALGGVSLYFTLSRFFSKDSAQASAKAQWTAPEHGHRRDNGPALRLGARGVALRYEF